MCSETENNYTALLGLVDACELLGEVALGDIRAVGVEDVDDKLAAGKQPVGEKLARAEGDGRVGLVIHSVSSQFDSRKVIRAAKSHPSPSGRSFVSKTSHRGRMDRQ